MIDDKSYEFYRLVKRVHLSASQRFDELLKEHNLARSQFQVLYLVAKSGQLSGKKLLAELHVESATLTGIVDTLEAKGWLKRLEDPTDRRAKLLQLTPSGNKQLAKVPNAAAIERRMLKGFHASDKKSLRKALEQMLINLERK